MSKAGEAVVMHWIYPDPAGPIVSNGMVFREVEGGRYRLACLPGKPSLKNVHATGEPWLVSCPKCRASRRFVALPEDRKARKAYDPSAAADAEAEMLEPRG